ncbi:acyl-CoA thioesterase-1 [Rhodanobacter sp. TND4EL1]
MTFFKIPLFALLLALTPLASSAHSAKVPVQTPKTVLLVGDSLSSAHRIPAEAGWVNRLQQRVNAASTTAPQIINVSRGGKTLTDAIKELPGLIAAHHPQLVILELGANDVILGAGRQELEKNMGRLIDVTRASGAEVVMLGFHIPPKLDKDHCADMLDKVYRQDSARQACGPVAFIDGRYLEPTGPAAG